MEDHWGQHLKKMHTYRRKALLFIIGLALVATVAVSYSLYQLSLFGFCGNGPRAEFSVTPESGQDYILLNNQNTNGAILYDKIRAAKAVPQGVLIGYVGQDGLASAVSFVNPEVIETCQVDGVGPQGHVNDIIVVNDTIWIATDGQGVWRYEKPQWRQLTTENSGLRDDRTYDLFENDGTVYVTTYAGVSVWNDGVWLKDTQPPPAFEMPMHAMLKDGNQSWYGTNSEGLLMLAQDDMNAFYRFEGGEGFGAIKIIPQLGSNNIRVVRKDPRTGWVWVGADPGLSAFDGNGNVFNFAPGGRPSLFDTLDIEFDSHNRIWATGTRSTYYFTLSASKNYTSDFYGNGGLTIEIGSEGVFANKVLIGTDGSGLYIGLIPPL